MYTKYGTFSAKDFKFKFRYYERSLILHLIVIFYKLNVCGKRILIYATLISRLSYHRTMFLRGVTLACRRIFLSLFVYEKKEEIIFIYTINIFLLINNLRIYTEFAPAWMFLRVFFFGCGNML